MLHEGVLLKLAGRTSDNGPSRSLRNTWRLEDKPHSTLWKNLTGGDENVNNDRTTKKLDVSGENVLAMRAGRA